MSEVDSETEERGPNAMARTIEARIAELEAEKAACRTREERRPINQHLHMLRDLLAWCKTRAGYVSAPEGI